MNQVKLALNICTYKREQILRKNLDILKGSEFFNSNNTHLYNKLEIFVIDNSSELSFESFPNLHLFHNPNTGGSGGFQRGIEEIRKHNDITHVIFMDDDVSFEMNTFYILYDFLETVDSKNADRPVAGRMLDKDNPTIQWTAGEKWNSGNIQHVEFLRDISNSNNPYTPGKVIYDADSDYGGFWFCCYPFDYVKNNDVIPFFLHCDDVEYGLRCKKKPIIIEGVHVWHETWEKKMSPEMLYYDYRNSLFVNEMYNFLLPKEELINQWKNKILIYRKDGKYICEYMLIKAMSDYINGMKWLVNLDSEKHHIRLSMSKTNKMRNRILMRYVLMKAKFLV